MQFRDTEEYDWGTIAFWDTEYELRERKMHKNIFKLFIDFRYKNESFK